MNITKEITSPTGKKVIISGRLELEKKVWLDGDTSVVPCCEIYGSVSVEGHGTVSHNFSIDPVTAMEKTKGKAAHGVDIIGKCGKLGLTQDMADAINAVRFELESHPAWIAQQTLIAKNEAEWSAEEKKRIANGYCPKCESYCYGGCNA